VKAIIAVDPAQFSLIGSISAHKGPVRGVLFASSGKELISGGADGQVRRWSFPTVKSLEPSISGAPIAAMAGCRRTGLLACALEDKTIAVHPGDGSGARTLPAIPAPIKCVAFSPDGDRLAAGSLKLLRLIDPRTGADGPKLPEQPFWVYSLSFSPDGKSIAVGGLQDVALYEVSSGKAVGRLQGHAGWVLGCAHSPDGKLLASASQDRSIRLWDLNDPERSGALGSLPVPSRCVLFSPSGEHVLSGSDDGAIRIWGVRDRKVLKEFSDSTAAVLHAVFSPDGRCLVVARESGQVGFYGWQQ
jgi:WD40 repeat protein